MSKKKKNVKVNANHKNNIKVFLNNLGIKRNVKEFNNSYWREIRDTGTDPDILMNNYGPFSEQINDMYFLNESIAKKTLSVDYDRIHDSLNHLKYLNGFPQKPSKICELGGGAGIISMWLAQQYNDSKVAVIDQAVNPMQIGRKWAAEMNICNIDFKRATYNAIEECEENEKFDLIVAFHPIITEIPMPRSKFHESIQDVILSELQKDLVEPIEEFAKACKKIISENGIIYLEPGVSNELGLFVLLKSLRDQNLGIDWVHTTASCINCNGDKNCFEGGISGLSLFLIPNMPSILDNAWEDMMSLMLMAQWTGKTTSLRVTDFETYFDLLRSGKKILDIKIRMKDTSVEKIYIYKKSGMVGFFRIRNDFVRNGMIHSAAAIFEIITQIKNGINQNDLEIVDEFYHPDLIKIMESYS